MSREGLEKLNVWLKAKNLTVFVYTRVIPSLPSSEQYNLTDQIRRAATSIPANIAEGYGRFYYQETIRFCYIARGSLEELISHIMLAEEIGELSKETELEVLLLADEVGRLINGYIAYLKKTKIGEHEPGAYHVISEDDVEYLPSPDNEQD